MSAFIIRRLLQGLITIIIVTMLVFVAIRLLPGDPLLLYMSQNEQALLQPPELQALRAQYGLDQPLPVQYINWIGDIVRGNLGESFFFKEKVSTLIAERLPVTLHIGLSAFLLAAILGPIFGILCALRRNTWIDNLLTVIANLGITTPGFWLGILMIYVFAMNLRLLPALGYTSPFEDPWMSFRQTIMPVLCMSVVPMASLTRQTRSSVLEVIRQDYIRTAWAKGLLERAIVTRHVIKNAFIPIITVMGLHVRFVFGGSVLIETIFNIPGIGRMIVSGVLSQDYHVIQAGVLLMAIIVMLANLLVDTSYGYFDPRIRLGEEAR